MNNPSPFAFVEQINRTVEQYIEENFHSVSAEDCGLDPRAAYQLFVNDQAVVCDRNAIGRLDYYGGFEYVDQESRVQVGDYVFFFRDGCDDRVNRAIDTAVDKLAAAA